MLVQLCYVEQVVLYILHFSDKNVTVRLEFVIAQNIDQLRRIRGSFADVTGANVGNIKTELIEQLLHLLPSRQHMPGVDALAVNSLKLTVLGSGPIPVISHSPGNEWDIPISYENSPKRKQILERPEANTQILLRLSTIPLTR